MKQTSTKSLAFLLIFTFLIPSAFATRWRVNNTGISADFITAQQAANSILVFAGDTLYLESSMISYGNLDLAKRLVVIGPGFFLGQNPQTQANIAPAMIENLTFSKGSKGSVMTGMTISSWTNVQDTAITLVRNNLGGVMVYAPSINNNVSCNYINHMAISGSTGNNVTNNVFIRNYPCWSGNCFSVDASSSASVRNNIFAGCQSVSNCTYQNNIATGTAAANNNTFTAAASIVDHNIGASTQYGNASGNQENIDMSMVFVNTGSDDGRYMLLPGSPAIGAGDGGVDCGIFGGPTPYVLSGMPNLPSVWHTSLNGNTMTVKVTGH